MCSWTSVSSTFTTALPTVLSTGANLWTALGVLAGSTAAATALLPLLQNDYALAQIVPENDARLVAETVSFDAPGGKVSGYLVRLKEKGKRPAVLVIHENRGLNPHIKDVTRRLALEGFLAYGIDLLSTSGGTPTDEDKGRDMIGKMNLDETEKQAVAAVTFLKKHPEFYGQGGRRGLLLGRCDDQPARRRQP